MIESNNIVYRIAELSDLDEIIDFEMRKLRESVPNEEEAIFASWKARWRRESLEHYLPLGWSFLGRDRSAPSAFSAEGALMGYFLGQPLLFLEGQTQSLWIEHLQHSSLRVRDELVDLAYRLSREKHFQRVYFPKHSSVVNSVKSYLAEDWAPAVLSVKTTK